MTATDMRWLGIAAILAKSQANRKSEMPQIPGSHPRVRVFLCAGDGPHGPTTLHMGKVRECAENPKQKNAPGLEDFCQTKVNPLNLRKNKL
ncbi:MAG: hypothetical protein AB7S99_05915 [Pseudodonghicola sp.]